MDGINPRTVRERTGQQFTFEDGFGRTTPLTLRVTSERSDGGSGALLAEFAAAEPHGLAQGTYAVTCAGLAPSALFAVPTSPTELCVTFTWVIPSPDGA